MTNSVVHYSGTGCNRTYIEAGDREDSGVFTEADVLTCGMRDEMDAFYDRIDFDLANDSGKEVW